MIDWSDAPVFGDARRLESAIVRPSAYGLLADGRNRLAVVRTPRGYYLPGGGIESDESPDQTVVRETGEECGLTVTIGGWMTRAIDVVFSPAERVLFAKRSTFVEVHLVQAAARPGEQDHDVLWLDVQDAARRLAHASHRWAVKLWEAHVLGA